MRTLVLLAGLLVVGCGVNPGKNPDPVEISGKVTRGGRPITDVVLNLQPTGSGTQAMYPVVNGEFKGKATPGKYTYYFSQGRNPANFRGIPEKYQSGAMDRQVDISAGASLTLTID